MAPRSKNAAPVAPRTWEAAEIKKLEEIETAALAPTAPSMTAAVAARKEIIRLRARLEDKRIASSVRTCTDAVRRAELLRDAAVAAGSHVAAGKADDAVYARHLEREQREEQARRERLEHVADEDVLDMIISAARDLTRDQALALAAVLLERPDITHDDVQGAQPDVVQ